jgi:hypothetical protein
MSSSVSGSFIGFAQPPYIKNFGLFQIYLQYLPLFTDNHYCSFICLKDLMTQQVPSLVISIYSLENCFADKLLCYFISLQNFPGNLLCHFISLQMTENQVFQWRYNGKKLASVGIKSSTY